MELKHPSEPENLSHLSEIFNKIVSECKTTLPLLDDLLSVTVKLESELESVCSVFTSFLDCVQKLRDSAVNTQSTDLWSDIGTFLTSFILQNRTVENLLKSLARSLHQSLTQPIQAERKQWVSTVQNMEKIHKVQHKKFSSAIKKRKDCVGKIQRKIERNFYKGDKLLNMRDELLNDIDSYNQRCLTLERASLEKIETLQRSMFVGVADGLRSVLAEEAVFLVDGDKNKINCDLTTLARLSETHYDTYSIGSGVSSVDTADIWFPTPPATPNLSLRPSSRTASIHSVSSRPSSVASYYSFHRNNNGAPSVQQEELTFKQQQRASSQSRCESPSKQQLPVRLTRVRPPVPVRTCSLDRRSNVDNNREDKSSQFSTELFLQKHTSTNSEDSYSNAFDDMKTPTNENINIFDSACVKNNNLVVYKNININQFELPPPSYDQIT